MITFNKTTHSGRSEDEVIEVYYKGELRAVITPTPNGIRISGKCFMEDPQKPVKVEFNKNISPPSPSVMIELL